MKALDIKYINKFTGYKNYRDITNLEPTDITAGSQNVFINDGANIGVRGGSRFFGAEGTVGTNTDTYWTLAHRINSDYDKFVNSQGTPTPIRVYYSGTTAVGDVFEVWLPIYSGGTATSAKKWYTASITNSPSSPIISNHEYYWAEWWDNINLLPTLVFVAGTNKVKSWTVGYANITSVGATTLTTDATWASKGFLNAADGGSDTIVVNGKAYVTNGDFSTNTVTIAGGTTGVSVDDVAFHNIISYTSPDNVIFDVCSMVNNQVYYIDWRQRNVLVSWNRNQNASLSTTIYQGTSGLDDGVFTGTYTGTTTDTYKVTITAIHPGIDTQTFTSNGGANSGSFDTSGYSASGDHTYILSIVSDIELTPVGASVSGVYTHGQVFQGATSGCRVQLVAFVGGSVVGGANFKLLTPGVYPSYGETFNDVTNPANTFDLLDNAVIYNSAILYKDGVQQTSIPGLFDGVLQLNPAGSFTLVDGLNFVVSTAGVGGNVVGDYYTLNIQTERPDEFQYSINGTTQPGTFNVNTSNVSLSQGISIHWVKTTGHAVGDSWTIVAHPKIRNGYRNFTYTQPTRLPGEGFKILLDSNGWAMTPQEKAMYINGSAGEYYEVTTQLSSDLLSETLQVQRLKTEPQNKVLYPYLMQYTKNFIVTISQDKTYDILGRQEFLELPQTRTLSDEVRVDFFSADWENARIKYVKRKTFFIIPKTGEILVYDEYMKYWHAPQVFARRISNIGFIDGKIVGHSYERNETYELFTADTSDLDIYPISTKIVFPYDDYGKRFDMKSMSAFAVDGFMTGNPNIKWKINAGVGGCDGTPNGTINPQQCLPTDTASLGKSSLGFHGLGNSPSDTIPHFKYGKTFNNQKYYLRNIELSCDELEQRWYIVSIGTTVETQDLSNSNMFNISN